MILSMKSAAKSSALLLAEPTSADEEQPAACL
jgi:hypothetical protein